MLKFEATYDLKRIADKVNQETFFHSYIKKYGRKPESYSNFLNIYAQIDFIDQLINQLQAYIEKEFFYIVEMKKKFVDYLEEAEMQVALLTVNPYYMANEKQVVSVLNSFSVNYQLNVKDSNDIDYPVKSFVEPIMQFLTTYHRHKIECNNIVAILRKSITRYNIVIAKSQKLAEELQEYYNKKLVEHSSKLESLIINLTNDFEMKLKANEENF